MAVDLNMPVLIVDDYKTMLRIIRNLLKQIGFNNVDEATDGKAALEKMQQRKYGLVISDWNMEPMNGQMLLQKIRADEQNKHLHFIMMTADSAIDKIVQAKHLGVSGFINKPFNAEALRAKISQIG